MSTPSGLTFGFDLSELQQTETNQNEYIEPAEKALKKEPVNPSEEFVQFVDARHWTENQEKPLEISPTPMNIEDDKSMFLFPNLKSRSNSQLPANINNTLLSSDSEHEYGIYNEDEIDDIMKYINDDEDNSDHSLSDRPLLDVLYVSNDTK